MKRFLSVVLLFAVLISCQQKTSDKTLKTGIWRATIEIQGQPLPFNFDLTNDASGGYDLYILNAGERLLLDEIKIKNDSIDIELHVFDANIKGKISGDTIIGEFIKNYETDYNIPFVAVFGQKYRFPKSQE